MANWAELIPDLLSMIAKKVEVYEDFVAFRGVCRSWRSAGVKNNYFPVPEKQVPWLLLAGDDDDRRHFYSLTNGGMVHTVDLPEASGKRILSSLGWLITIDKDGEMQLLHPLSRLMIPLPGASKFSDRDCLDMRPINALRRAVLSASPSDNDSYGLMIVIGAPAKLAYWTPSGGNVWKTIQTPHPTVTMEEVVYCRGKFYALNCEGSLFSIDIHNKTADLVGKLPTDVIGSDHCYLIDSGDEGDHLIAVLREIREDVEDIAYLHGQGDISLQDLKFGILNYWTNSFQLFKFDSSFNCHVMNDFGGGRSLFLGQCAPVVLAAGADGNNIRPNCIYFTDDAYCQYGDNEEIVGGGGRDMGVYSLQHKETIKDVTLYNGNKGLSPLTPPLWVLPSF